jgi:aryl-alcohol dehydrogenase-like predicted oxidoreductase
VIPIPGTTNIAHLEDDLAASEVALSADIAARLDALINERSISGDRYNAVTQAEIDTENF